MPHQSVESGDEFLTFDHDVYRTAPRDLSWLSRTFPSLSFYRQFVWSVYRSSVKAKRGAYDDREWIRTSHQMLEALESVGLRVEVAGVEHVRKLGSPCVFVSNHMSMFETIVLPSIIQPVCPVTFVVKQGLLDYPMFRHIIRSRDPIAVSRENPREDLRTMLNEGTERLKKGISVVVFPQTTRSMSFDPSQFNSIGVKLASRAGVPVIPIALKTDAWANGKWVKDLGVIDPRKPVHLSFGPPMQIEDRGAKQQSDIIEYIETKLNLWSKGDPR